jgi:hypothetical protein
MEEDIHTYQSPASKPLEKLEDKLDKAIEIAENRIKKDIANDESLVNALFIVHEFLKDKKRVCYGGTAMNAILPKSKKFYDPNIDLPDYDFYTPDLDTDVKELVETLAAAGYKDVYHKYGIHEGTKKILVNYVAVADITYIDKEIYDILYRRSIVIQGVHYTDDLILRMMMYLELSRPIGMPSRWKKVFERLQVINDLFPVRGCHKSKGENTRRVSMQLREKMVDFIIENNRILCNGPLEDIYTKGIKYRSAKYKLAAGGPIFFVSPDPKADAINLRRLLSDDIVLYKHHEKGEIVPERVELKLNDHMICLIVQENACHSYRNIPLNDGRTICIASLEFLITLYLSMAIFTNHAKHVLGTNVMCRISTFMKLLDLNYKASNSQFSTFTLECKGHQTSFPSLLKKKVNRIKKERGELMTKKKSKTSKSKTSKRKTKKRHDK